MTTTKSFITFFLNDFKKEHNLNFKTTNYYYQYKNYKNSFGDGYAIYITTRLNNYLSKIFTVKNFNLLSFGEIHEVIKEDLETLKRMTLKQFIIDKMTKLEDLERKAMQEERKAMQEKRNRFKKLYKKNDRILNGILEYIEGGGLENSISELTNCDIDIDISKWDREEEIKLNLKYKFYNLDYCYLKDIIKDKGYSQEAIEMLEEEFCEDRIDGSYEHANDIAWDNIDYDFNEAVGKENVEVGSDSYYNFFYINIHNNDIDLYCDDLIDLYNIKTKGYLFKKHGSLDNVVEAQKTMIKNFFKAKRNLDRLLRELEEVNISAKAILETMHSQQLEEDVQRFILENNLIMTSNADNIKYDYIEKFIGNELVTNKGARVPIEEAKNILQAFKNGEDILNKKVGAFTIRKIFNISDNIFIRIGCHLIRINQELESKLA